MFKTLKDNVVRLLSFKVCKKVFYTLTNFEVDICLVQFCEGFFLNGGKCLLTSTFLPNSQGGGGGGTDRCNGKLIAKKKKKNANAFFNSSFAEIVK